MTFSGGAGFWKAIGAVDQAGADGLIKSCVEAGINFFDTADVYSEGESERILGQSFKNLNIARKDVVIATKVFGRVGPGRNDVGASRGHIMDAVDASLRRLQTDHIDLYQIHGNDSITPIEETLRALILWLPTGKSATSAYRIGMPGKSPKPWGFRNSKTWRASKLCKRIIPLRVAISNAKSYPCSKPKRPVFSCGAHSPAAF